MIFRYLNDVQDAVEAAGKAFESWEHMPAAHKRAILLKAADLIMTEKYKDKFAKAMREETAAADTWIAFNIASSRGGILEAASQATQIKGESFPSSASVGGLVIVQRRAHGAMYVCQQCTTLFCLTDSLSEYTAYLSPHGTLR